jgi:predicted transcriptional regulator
MKYRSRTEIVCTILEATRTGATKTKIMYKAYLSYAQLKEYLTYMGDSGIIRYEEGTQVYRITEKGIKLTHLYEEIQDLVSLPTDDRLAKIVR